MLTFVDMKKVAINGCGRIGRLVLKRLLNQSGLQVVAVNDLSQKETLAHLLRYDSIHGRLSLPVAVEQEDYIRVGAQRVKVLRETDPSKLPWREYGVSLVIEASGRFTDSKSAGAHLEAGAKQVLISAPATGDVTTIVLGVNDALISDKIGNIVSNASCTTNCLAPMVKVLDDAFGIEKGYITTVHAYTADQRLHDSAHSDLRRARAACLSMVPTSTGAARAVGLVLPHLAGKLDGMAVRVPVPNGSLTDLVVLLKKNVDKKDVNRAMEEAAKGHLRGILQYTEDPIVSVDIVGNAHSCIFDSQLTATNGHLVKAVGWYDNETGYSQRIVDLATRLLNG